MIKHLTERESRQVLQQQVLGRIGCTDGKKLYVVPINYVYDGKAIICHSLAGQKISMMQTNPQVCFEVDEMTSFTNWKSVIAYGRYEELTDETGRFEAMKLFVDRMQQTHLSKSAVPAEMNTTHPHPHTGNKKTYVFRIVIDELTGRYENDRKDD